MKIEMLPGDRCLRRATNGWIVASVEEIEEGVQILTETVAEDNTETDPEGVLAAMGLLFEDYRQWKRNPGYTAQWHNTGWEAEEESAVNIPGDQSGSPEDRVIQAINTLNGVLESLKKEGVTVSELHLKVVGTNDGKPWEIELG